jgi:hypothetical protein
MEDAPVGTGVYRRCFATASTINTGGNAHSIAILVPSGIRKHGTAAPGSGDQFEFES